MGLLASRLYRIDAATDDPAAPAPQPLFQPAFQPCSSADNAALQAVSNRSEGTVTFEQARHAEYRQWLTRLFGGPILVRLDRNHAHTPRLLVRYQCTHDCVLPDDRDKLVRDNPSALTYAIVDEATEYLLALWKADNRPNVFEVV